MIKLLLGLERETKKKCNSSQVGDRWVKSLGLEICPQRNCKCFSSAYELVRVNLQVKPFGKRSRIVEVHLTKAV